jgi:putative iron-only hydrogenase system regulator
LTITIYNRDEVYQSVSEILHKYADKVLIRTGYPIKEKNTAVIFLILYMTNNELGALSGKLGQIKDVKVNATTLKI